MGGQFWAEWLNDSHICQERQMIDQGVATEAGGPLF